MSKISIKFNADKPKETSNLHHIDAYTGVASSKKYYKLDPDSQVKRERDKGRVLFHKLPRFAFYFTLILFLVILPLTEMQLYYTSFWHGLQDWARAFWSTANTALVSLAAIAVSTALPQLYKYIKEQDKNGSQN